jgi:hypothetical protein
LSTDPAAARQRVVKMWALQVGEPLSATVLPSDVSLVAPVVNNPVTDAADDSSSETESDDDAVDPHPVARPVPMELN